MLVTYLRGYDPEEEIDVESVTIENDHLSLHLSNGETVDATYLLPAGGGGGWRAGLPENY